MAHRNTALHSVQTEKEFMPSRATKSSACLLRAMVAARALPNSSERGERFFFHRSSRRLIVCQEVDGVASESVTRACAWRAESSVSKDGADDSKRH